MQKFIALSQISKELLNSAMLLKNLDVNVLIRGEKGCGKKSLARQIAQEETQLYKVIKLQNDVKDDRFSIEAKELIIEDIDELINIDSFILWANKNSIRVIATTSKQIMNKELEEFFHFTLDVPNLENRKEDTIKLAEKFSKEIRETLGIKKSPKDMIYDLSLNSKSLRRSIYFSYLIENVNNDELMQLLEKIFSNLLLNSNSSYKELLSLFEIPLLKASKKIYKSQLQMAKKLDITRVTLRKKLDCYKNEMLK